MRLVLAGLLAAARAVCRAGTLAAFLALIGVVTIQVLGRVPGFPSFAWTEEVARFALVYLVGFSCGLALLRGEMVNVDLFTAPLPEAARRVIDRLVDLIVLGFCLAILPGAWDYVAFSAGERARSLDMPMIVIYAVMLLIPASLALFSVFRLLGFAEKPPASHGELT
ncbi:TRAP transporter small permease [Pseudoroseomonas cervicalis]|uniref:TRAP transporter small permease protein n=1 Tax=Pseudoroseomonas cervicalis ATCC 49957 TaxID=525371 RepID=D5RJV2_9PROT|nr:TRAP transporter small permease subunit [Pseudoroseomonas cervicalis]EFH12415.1 TRAP transporter, DctQ-like membrane protein [Pseudoroseomonas cervicalis ATCC 49957]